MNFAFVEENTNQDLVRLFDFADNGRIIDASWNLQDRRIVRKMVHENDSLNLTLLFDGKGVTAEFNFHTETTSNEAARKAIQGRVLGLRDTAIQLLKEVYHLELAQEYNDG